MSYIFEYIFEKTIVFLLDKQFYWTNDFTERSFIEKTTKQMENEQYF